MVISLDFFMQHLCVLATILLIDPPTRNPLAVYVVLVHSCTTTPVMWRMGPAAVRSTSESFQDVGGRASQHRDLGDCEGPWCQLTCHDRKLFGGYWLSDMGRLYDKYGGMEKTVPWGGGMFNLSICQKNSICQKKFGRSVGQILGGHYQ